MKMKFNNIINKLLSEAEVTKDDKMAALKTLGSFKTYHVVNVGSSRGTDYINKVTEVQYPSLETAVHEVEQNYIKAIRGEAEEEGYAVSSEKFIRDWVFSKVVLEDDLGYVNEGDESGWLIVGSKSKFWEDSAIYDNKASSINNYINDNFF